LIFLPHLEFLLSELGVIWWFWKLDIEIGLAIFGTEAVF